MYIGTFQLHLPPFAPNSTKICNKICAAYRVQNRFTFENRSSVKFKNIGIYLRASSETVQSQLDRELLQFTVSMTMVGNNFFRCENKMFSISLNDEIIINVSFEKDANGYPIGTTDTVKMINKSDYFLSPYTWWVIKLEHMNATAFDNLKPYRNETIDLLLEGLGQHIKRDPNRPQICNENLKKYYTIVD